MRVRVRLTLLAGFIAVIVVLASLMLRDPTGRGSVATSDRIQDSSNTSPDSGTVANLALGGILRASPHTSAFRVDE